LARDGVPLPGSTARNFAFTPTLPGVYTVSLTVADDDGGVSATDRRTFIVYGGSLVADPNDSTLTALLVGGSAGSDTIQLSSAGGGRVRVDVGRSGGSLFSGVFRPTGHIIVIGQDGDDSITVNVPGVSSMLFGNAGADTLRSGGGDDMLLGGDGDDRLTSGSGRDLLIGGAGADTLASGNGDDILIGGSTGYDAPSAANLQALSRIQNEWTRPDRAYAQRLAHLLGTSAGGLNGAFLLTAQGAGQTVFDDAAADAVTGAGGQDWFFARRKIAVVDVLDASSGETVTET